MGTANHIIARISRCLVGLFAVALLTAAAALAQTSLQLDPAKTTVHFTLDAALHSVHGTFQAKPGTLQLDPAAGQVSGEILVDAKSGETGNGMRDRKMHNEVLESANYPDISFRPDRIAGTVANPGKSSVMACFAFTEQIAKSPSQHKLKYPKIAGRPLSTLRCLTKNGA